MTDDLTTKDARAPSRLPFSGATTRVRAAVARVGHADPLELAISMTLLVVLLHTVEVPNQLVRVMAVAALVYRPLARSPWFWLAIVWVRIAFQIPSAWWSIDNHQYLITWWCLALGLGLLARRPDVTLQLAARLLIGLCFAFATLWKVISPDFLDGTFLHWTLIRDGRFAAFTETFLGLPHDGQNLNRAALAELRRPPTPDSLPIVSGPRVGLAALAMSWWTVLIEAAVAVCYLSPPQRRLARFKDVVLLAFVLTIYPIAPVVGFAWVLLTMGLVASTRRSPWWITAVIVTFSLAPAFSWFDTLFRATSR